jgi:hypothetical protein
MNVLLSAKACMPKTQQNNADKTKPMYTDVAIARFKQTDVRLWHRTKRHRQQLRRLRRRD